MPRISFDTLLTLLETQASNHVDINDSYRWNASEFTGTLRSGTNLPVMLIDAPETQSSGSKKSRFHNNTIAITVLGKEGVPTAKVDSYDNQNEVLNFCQSICFDIETRLLSIASSPTVKSGQAQVKNWLYGLIDENSFHHFKVGPIFTERLFGYRCEITIKNQVSTVPDPAKWEDL